MRLIDADALIADTVDHYCKNCNRRKGIKNGKERFVYEIGDAPCRACGTGDMLDTLEDAPTVEPKFSEWLEDSDPGQEYGTTWACRKCMHSIHKPYIWNPYDSGYKYCFHCGARMERSVTDETD